MTGPRDHGYPRHYALNLGIEHLMTGIQLFTDGQTQLIFQCESPSIVRVTSCVPFRAIWPLNDTRLNAFEVPGRIPRPVYSREEAAFLAHNMSEAMRKCAGERVR